MKVTIVSQTQRAVIIQYMSNIHKTVLVPSLHRLDQQGITQVMKIKGPRKTTKQC